MRFEENREAGRGVREFRNLDPPPNGPTTCQVGEQDVCVAASAEAPAHNGATDSSVNVASNDEASLILTVPLVGAWSPINTP